MAEHYSMKKAKELFGDSADDTIMKELKQIHLFETYEPLKASDLSWEEKKEALNSLLFVTEKKKWRHQGTKRSGRQQTTYVRRIREERRSISYGTHRKCIPDGSD